MLGPQSGNAGPGWVVWALEALTLSPGPCLSLISVGHTWAHLDDGPGGQKPDLEAAAFLLRTREMFLGVAPAQASGQVGRRL